MDTEILEDHGADGEAARKRYIRQDSVSLDKGQTYQRVRRIAHECVLDSLFWRKNATLTEGQWRAGMRFRANWLRLHQETGLTQRYDTRISGSPGAQMRLPESIIAARSVIDEALGALSPIQQRVMISVCGCDEAVGERRKTLLRALSSLESLWKQKPKS